MGPLGPDPSLSWALWTEQGGMWGRKHFPTSGFLMSLRRVSATGKWNRSHFLNSRRAKGCTLEKCYPGLEAEFYVITTYRDRWEKSWSWGQEDSLSEQATSVANVGSRSVVSVIPGSF